MCIVCLNFFSVEYDIEPYYEQISGLKPHEQAIKKDFPSTTQNMAYGQLQTTANVAMSENVSYGYCGVGNKESTLLQSHNFLHSAERFEEENEHIYSTVEKNW